MKFGVVIFPGSNCDDDVIRVLRDTMGQQVVKLWHKDHDLQNCDFIVLPGGFSYGDYLRSGAIARFSPIMQEVVQFANRGGYVFGICNGFQILAEAGLLPGALLRNREQQFMCKNVHLMAQNNTLLPTQKLSLAKPYKIPIAHGEGRYFASGETLEMLNNEGLVMFRYADENGEVNHHANCNGSLENIAGISNQGRNVFGMMPHPERAADPDLGNTDGLAIFESILDTVNA